MGSISRMSRSERFLKKVVPKLKLWQLKDHIKVGDTLTVTKVGLDLDQYGEQVRDFVILADKDGDEYELTIESPVYDPEDDTAERFYNEDQTDDDVDQLFKDADLD